jgi:hypothetical protein
MILRKLRLLCAWLMAGLLKVMLVETPENAAQDKTRFAGFGIVQG